MEQKQTALVFILVAFTQVVRVSGQCTGDGPLLITQPGTIIQSPGFNGLDPYPPNQTCEWRIQTSSFTRGVIVEFMTLVLEECQQCSCDSVIVYDGPDDTAPVLASLCGAPQTPPSLTGGPEVFIRFISDYSSQNIGFQATLPFYDIGCSGGVLISQPSGWITSPNYPNDYTGLDRCAWDFEAPVGQRIQIQFQDFNLAPSTCDFPLFGGGIIADFVQFTETVGNTTIELGRWYGFMEPRSFKYQNYDSNEASVRFFTDIGDGYSGFNMTWAFVAA